MESTAPAPEHRLPSSKAASLLACLGGARAALLFLTRIPCGKALPSPQAMGWAAAWFPAVGALLGLGAAAVLLGLQRAGNTVAAVAAVTFLALVTGAFHEDGLADSADALGGAFDRAKLFVILKDSRIGSFGATALVLVLLLRITALAKLGPLGVGVLLLSQTISRTSLVWLMIMLPYVTPSETASASRLVRARPVHVALATLLASFLVAAVLLERRLPLSSVLMALAVAAAVAALCGWRFRVRAGGLTGDFLGATQQITDAAILVAVAAST